MEPVDRHARGDLIRQQRSPRGRAELEIVRPGKTIDDPSQPHCADHARFQPNCVVCKRACANFQPYPVRRTPAPSRSFGYTDDLTEEKLRALNPRDSEFYADGDLRLHLAWNLLRLVRRLIWPF